MVFIVIVDGFINFIRLDIEISIQILEQDKTIRFISVQVVINPVDVRDSVMIFTPVKSSILSKNVC